jgi:hypothetical protein
MRICNKYSWAIQFSLYRVYKQRCMTYIHTYVHTYVHNVHNGLTAVIFMYNWSHTVVWFDHWVINRLCRVIFITASILTVATVEYFIDYCRLGRVCFSGIIFYFLKGCYYKSRICVHSSILDIYFNILNTNVMNVGYLSVIAQNYAETI